jgi:hydroxyacylglutathione hydrolase
MKINESVQTVPVGELEVNCVIVKCQRTGLIAIFDPGDESNKIKDVISRIGGKPEIILNTHCHYDHIGAVENIRNEYGIKYFVHELEKEYSTDPEINYSSVSNKRISIEPDGTFKDGDIIKVGDLKIRVIHTPGHTYGGCCFYFDNILIAGDTLFAGSVGRADLYGGDENILVASIKNKLMTLDDDTIVIPGHGRPTSIREEKRFNPFL